MGLAMLGALLFGGISLPVAAWAAESASPTVKVAQNTTLGNILADSRRMTLYTFKKDRPGDMNGQGLAGRWYVVPAITSQARTTGAASKGW
jgi:predicted lipoprotein with Yx(FWY)xxD motif